MLPVTQKFRSAFGGFNRRDVMRYIEQANSAHNRQIRELEERLNRAEQERDGLSRELSGLRNEQGDLAAEEAKVRASLEESTRTLARLRGELTQTETKLSVARAELERLQSKVTQLAPMAERYEQLKDRVATVGLDAHRKAQATIDEGREQAEQIREEARQWLGKALEEYDGLRSVLDGLFRSAREVSDWEERTRQSDEQANVLRGKVKERE